MNTLELKIEHYRQRVAELSVQYEERIADLRIEVTEKSVRIQELEEKVAELETPVEPVEVGPNIINDPDSE